MSPFKEPQPRKSPEGGTPDAPKGVFPPYARFGNEARWDEPKEGKLADAAPGSIYAEAPPTVTTSPDFELRKAALEAACALQTSSAREAFWKNLATCEDYLRDGTKPS